MFRSPEDPGFPMLPARSFWRRDVIETIMIEELAANDNAPLGIPAQVRRLAALAKAAAKDASRKIP